MSEKLSLQDLIAAAEDKSISFSEYCLDIQAQELEISPAELIARMIEVLDVMESSIEYGLTGEASKGGLVGGAAKKLKEYVDLPDNMAMVGQVLSDAIIIALAVGEANACMGKIVAAPTAGSSGVMPAVIFSIGKMYKVARSDLAKGLVVGGVIGMVIASRASLSGAEGGCQAECGSAAAMAAGTAVSLLGGSSVAVGHAVAIALKNMLGLVCDPVAGLVEVPCVKRNAGAAAQALVAAQMAMAGITSAIPVDEVIDAMAEVGRAMNCTLKETAQGGLAATPTAVAWTNKLFA